MISRRVLITGGVRGLGKAIAQKFYEAIHKVGVAYNSDVQSVEKLGKEILTKAFKWDVGDFVACNRHISEVEAYLDGSIEILVNNAGITKNKMFHKNTNESWESVLCTNLFSVFNMSHSVIQKMRDKKFGRIINISSVNANGMSDGLLCFKGWY